MFFGDFFCSLRWTNQFSVPFFEINKIIKIWHGFNFEHFLRKFFQDFIFGLHNNSIIIKCSKNNESVLAEKIYLGQISSTKGFVRSRKYVRPKNISFGQKYFFRPKNLFCPKKISFGQKNIFRQNIFLSRQKWVFNKQYFCSTKNISFGKKRVFRQKIILGQNRFRWKIFIQKRFLSSKNDFFLQKRFLDQNIFVWKKISFGQKRFLD